MNKLRLHKILCVVLLTAAIAMSATSLIQSNRSIRESRFVESEILMDDMQFMLATPEEGLLSALKFFRVDSADWVFCQAICETSMGHAGVGESKNNLFGIYNSQERQFESYDYWWESVMDYKVKIQSKMDSADATYTDFLQRIGYAESHTYIDKLQSLHKRYFE